MEFINPKDSKPDLKEFNQSVKDKSGKIKIFASFKFRNYKLWFVGQATSLLGTWMQTAAQQYLIYELTGSSAFVGTVSFVSGIPSWLFMLFGGVVADRTSKRRLMIVTQSGMMILAFILAGLVFTGLVTPTLILILAFMLGLFNAFDAPARQAFVSELVDREHLTNAIAMNSLMFNLGTAFGPAIAGIIYYLFKPGWCFTINGISFIAVIIALSMMIFPYEKIKNYSRTSGSSLVQLGEGFRFVWEDKQVFYLMLMLCVTALFSSSVITLFPAWSKVILGGDERLFGLMMSARGVGAIFSAVLIASLGNSKLKGKLLLSSYFAFPVIIIGFSFIRSQIFALIVLLFFGFALILIFNLTNALVQESTPNHLRGRVMSIYSLTFFGLMPFGSLWAGWVAKFSGEQVSMLIAAGLSLIVVILLFILAPKFRAI